MKPEILIFRMKGSRLLAPRSTRSMLIILMMQLKLQPTREMQSSRLWRREFQCRTQGCPLTWQLNLDWSGSGITIRSMRLGNGRNNYVVKHRDVPHVNESRNLSFMGSRMIATTPSWLYDFDRASGFNVCHSCPASSALYPVSFYLI